MLRDWIDENYSQDYSQIVFGKSQECISKINFKQNFYFLYSLCLFSTVLASGSVI